MGALQHQVHRQLRCGRRAKKGRGQGQGCGQWGVGGSQEVVGFAPVAPVPSSVTTGALHRQWLKLTADSQRAVYSALGKAAA